MAADGIARPKGRKVDGKEVANHSAKIACFAIAHICLGHTTLLADRFPASCTLHPDNSDVTLHREKYRIS